MKRIISFAIVAVMMLSMFTTIEADEVSGCDLTSSEIALLQELSIVDDIATDYDIKITRGELAHIISKLSKATDTYSAPAESPFYDVNTNHPYYEDICALLNMGVISGDGRGYFLPEEQATYTAACKMFSIILGYTFAEGRYPWSVVAKKAGILEGIKVESDKLTLGIALEFAYNALHSNVLDASMFVDDIAYLSDSGSPAVEYYHGLLVRKGIVSGAAGTTLTSPDVSIDKDELIVDGQKYAWQNAQAYLGKAVVLYVNKEDAKESLIAPFYLHEDERKNNTLTVQAKDIRENFSSNEFKYYEGTSKKTQKITGNMDVIYNGVAHPNWIDSDFDITDGRVTFLDNNKDSYYDVVFITSYYFAIVDSFDTENVTIHCQVKNGSQSINKQIGNKDAIMNLTGDGKFMHPSSLQADAVVAVAESKNTSGNKKIDLELINNTFSGKVTGQTSESIIISGTEYRLTGGLLSDEPVRLGDNVVAYIYNETCAVIMHGDGSDFNVGYLLDAELFDIPFGESMRIKLVNYSRKEVIYDCAENLKIDGTSYKENLNGAKQALYDANYNYAYNTSAIWAYKQLIRFQLDAEGKVKYIDTANYNAEVESEDSLQRHQFSDGSYQKSLVYWSDTGAFTPRYDDNGTEQKAELVASPNIKRFGVPYSTPHYEEATFYFLGFEALSNNSSRTTLAYNVGKYNKQVEYMITYHYLDMSIEPVEPVLITGISLKVNDKGEEVYKLEVHSSSSTVIEIPGSIMDTSARVGDMIQLRGLNSKYTATKIVLRRDDNFEELLPTDRIIPRQVIEKNKLPGNRIAYGTVYSLTDTHLLHTTSLEIDVPNTPGTNAIENCDNLSAFKISAATPILIYDSNRQKVISGSINDLKSYEVNKSDASKVFVSSSNGTIRFIYMIK